MTGEGAWLDAVRTLLPELAAAFGPDIVVCQHGADSHAWDPLAHLRVTTTAMGEAARLVDAVAHRYAGGRWLATGGGGYDAYRVVPRIVEPRSGSRARIARSRSATPADWRERWAAEGARYGQAPLPDTFIDPPNAGIPIDCDAGRRRGEVAGDDRARPGARWSRDCCARPAIAAGGTRSMRPPAPPRGDEPEAAVGEPMVVAVA